MRSITDGNALQVESARQPGHETSKCLPKHHRTCNNECPDRRYPAISTQIINHEPFLRTSELETHVEILKCPAVYTAQRTYPTTALSTNDAATAVARNTNNVNIAYMSR